MVSRFTGVVLSKVGGVHRLYVAGVVEEASLRGRLKIRSRRLLVGDIVRFVRHEDGFITIEDIEPRKSVLRRRMPGRAHGVRSVAANIDRVMVVGSATDPAWDPTLIDRFVAVAEANDLSVTVVVNKADLLADAETLAAPYLRAGYDYIITSASTGRGVQQLRDALRDHITLFVGPTGVGKSSLLNSITPGLELRTRSVSEKSRSGRHTTVAAEMHPLDGGGFAVDTPGLRDVGLWGLDPGAVARAFPEFATFAGGCRFDNCRHFDEPACAVRTAAATGALAPSRLDSYRVLFTEAQRASRSWARKG